METSSTPKFPSRQICFGQSSQRAAPRVGGPRRRGWLQLGGSVVGHPQPPRLGSRLKHNLEDYLYTTTGLSLKTT